MVETRMRDKQKQARSFYKVLDDMKSKKKTLSTLNCKVEDV